MWVDWQIQMLKSCCGGSVGFAPTTYALIRLGSVCVTVTAAGIGLYAVCVARIIGVVLKCLRRVLLYGNVDQDALGFLTRLECL